jgi:hypothetical protein
MPRSSLKTFDIVEGERLVEVAGENVAFEPD